MTNPMTDHINEAIKKAMTDAEMLEKLENIEAALGDFSVITNKEYVNDLNSVIEAIKVRVEAETKKIVECVDSPLKRHMYLAVSGKRNSRVYLCQFCSQIITIKDKDDA